LQRPAERKATIVNLSILTLGAETMNLASLSNFSSLWFVVMTWLSGAGVPLGVPPLPPDPALSAVAPEHCLFYMSSAGMAAADPHSGNQTERLMVEPELRQMVRDIEMAIRSSLAETMKDREMPEEPSAETIVALAETPLVRPWAAYVSEIKTGLAGPAIRAGMILNLGPEAAKSKTAIDQLIDRELPNPAATVTIAAAPWRQWKPSAGLTITWGQWGEYLVVGFGQGEAEAILKRIGPPGSAPQASATRRAGPAFLAKLRADLPIDRVSTVSYLNSTATEAAPAGVLRPHDPELRCRLLCVDVLRLVVRDRQRARPRPVPADELPRTDASPKHRFA
jgi:hypothetical protein